MERPEGIPFNVRIEPCNCGSEHCTRHGFSNLGVFYQGSGFQKEVAEYIAYLLNNDPQNLKDLS